MLTSLRNNLRGFVAVFIIGLIGVAFVVTDIRDVFTPNTANGLANGKDVEVTDAEFRRAFDNAVNFVRQSEQNNAISQRDLVDRGIDRQILNRLVAEKAISGWGRRIGLYVSEQIMLDRIQETFRDPVTNTFNADAYRADLARRELTAPVFEAALRDELLRTQTLRVLQVGVHAPASMGRAQALLLSEERTISVARLPDARIPQIAAPSEADLAAWYQSPPMDFIRPEQRTLTLYVADPKAFTDKISLTQDEIDRQFNFLSARRGTPERRSFVQISFALEEGAKADQAATRLRAGEAPAAVAQALAGQLVTVSDRDRDGVGDPALADRVFQAGAPGAVEVVETGLGVAAIRLTAITPATAPPREALLAEVREQLLQQRAEGEVQKAVDAFEKAKTEGEEIPAAAAAAGIRLVTLDLVDIRGFNDAGQPMPDAQGMPQKLQEAFTTPDGETTGFARVADGRWISARVDSVRASSVRPLAEVRERAIAVYRRQKTQEALDALARALVQDVAGGKSFAEAVRARGFAIDGAPRTVTRRSPVDPSLRQAWGPVFNGTVGDAISAGQSPRLTVVHIDRINRPQDVLSPQVIEATRGDFQTVLPELVFQAGVQNALGEANTRINQQRLDAIVGRRAGGDSTP